MVDWNMLSSPTLYEWKDGVTPFSSPLFPLSACLAYFFGIRGLQAIMKSRPAFDLNLVNVIHNLNLLVLSFVMMTGTLWAAFDRSQESGPFSIFCEPFVGAVNGRLGYWVYIFHLSKYYELFDTVLLALRKKEIIPLHFGHHLVMVPLSFSWHYTQWLAGSWWCAFVNSLIHTFMYYYYLQTSLSVDIPWQAALKQKDIWWKQYLTSMQIVQFFTGTAVVFFWLYHYYITESCHVIHSGAAHASNLINLSFIVSFIQLYIRNYVKNKKTKAADKSESDKARAAQKTD